MERVPVTVDELLSIAVRHHQAGQFRPAESLYRQVLELAPDNANALHLLGVILHQRGEHEAALEYILRAVRSNDRPPFFHNNLGAVYAALRRIPEAMACYQRALERNPSFDEAHNNLGNAWKDLGNVDEAIACYRRALALNPNSVEAHNNLGNALTDQGKLDEAIACYQRALALNPNYAEAYCNLGNARRQQKRLDEAAANYRRAIELKPDSAEMHYNLAHTYRDEGKVEEAAACYRRAIEIKPSDTVRFDLATLLPIIYGSTAEVTAVREQLVRDLSALVEQNVRFDPRRDVLSPTFTVAYQGFNDRDIHRTIAQLWDRPAEDSARKRRRPARAGARVRFGILSRYLKDHTVGHLWRGLIAGLSRPQFEVIVFSLAPADDPITRFIRQHADVYRPLPARVPAAQDLVAKEDLDILLFTDVGMDGLTTSLAASRLAPVQCATWGHPVTTGLPTVDYFLSSGLMEPDDADSHYTERLIRFQTLGLYLYRPPQAPPKSRKDFGLPEDKHLYGCLQSLFKIHPDDDFLLGEILRRDPQGEVVLLSGLDPHWEHLLRQRFAVSMPEVADRVRFLPRQSAEDFLRLNAVMDVLVDPLHFGGGRTSYEAFALGKPVVTLPSAYLRGRITYAMYRAMGVTDCIASDQRQYIEIAVRLGTDRDYRAAVGDKILAASGRLFEDHDALREQERVFLDACL